MNGRVWLGSMVLLLAACGGAPPSSGTDAGPGDAGITLPDTGPASMCANHIPDPDHNVADQPFGVQNGRSFRPFTLNDCDGIPYPFYGHDYCDPDTRFTVLIISAGWCVPCQMESAQLVDRVVNVYGPRGVNVVQVLVQDALHMRPDGAFCHSWQDTYGLTGYVPDLVDPEQITNGFFPDGALPSNIIVDDQGIVRFHENGLTIQLSTMTAELDRLLAGP